MGLALMEGALPGPKVAGGHAVIVFSHCNTLHCCFDGLRMFVRYS